MNVDPATQMVSMLASRTQEIAQIKMLRAEHQMQMDLIAMLDEVVRSAPPPGQGLQVDKRG